MGEHERDIRVTITMTYNPKKERSSNTGNTAIMRTIRNQSPLPVTFDEWTQERIVPSLGTNAGATVLPFQNWRNFKEAFAPELIARAIEASYIPVKRCLDPFGGSGTTALACQFLGVHPITVEINPFLADLIEAKLDSYDADALAKDLTLVLGYARNNQADNKTVFQFAPRTFVQPGVNGRWVFDDAVATRIAALRLAIEALPNQKHRRLFLVILGGILVSVSNVVISGKGRRYRRRWQDRCRDPHEVDNQFCNAAQKAIVEAHRFRQRGCSSYKLIRGDSREVLNEDASCDLAVFSPPYPNSFDYTDVYNLELWTLGYLDSTASNHSLRKSTLCSHVQIKRDFPQPPPGSSTLVQTLEKLESVKGLLWNPWIPAMVGGYFADLVSILSSIHRLIKPLGTTWMVLGDSRYADVSVDTTTIVAELATHLGWKVESSEPFRSMRASPQQGGREELSESLIVISKC